jgi:hypothetical protein
MMPIAAETRIFGDDGSVYTLKSKIISPYTHVRFYRKFSAGSTELWEEMAVHDCEEIDEKGTGLIEWLYSHPNE